MAAHFDKSCLYSTVKNISGGERYFDFLPPTGVKLASDAEYTVWGHILEALVRVDRSGSQIHRQAFLAALDAGDITIISTPAPVLLDSATDASKILTLTSGTLGTADPCWEDSDSLDIDAAP